MSLDDETLISLQKCKPKGNTHRKSFTQNWWHHTIYSASLGVVLLWGFRCSSISSRLTNFILSSYVSTSGYSCIWRHISCIFKTPTSWLTDELNSILHPQYKDYLPPPGHTDFWTQSLCLSEVGIQSQSVRFRHLKSRECIWEDFKKNQKHREKRKISFDLCISGQHCRPGVHMKTSGDLRVENKK